MPDEDIPLSALKANDVWDSPQMIKNKDSNSLSTDKAVLSQNDTSSPCETNSTVSTRIAAGRRRKLSQKLIESEKTEDNSVVKRTRKQKSTVLDDTRSTPSSTPSKSSMYSQKTMEGAEILLGMNKDEMVTIPKKKGGSKNFEYHNYVSTNGIDGLIAFRSRRGEKMKNIIETDCSSKPTPRKSARNEVYSTTYHMSQSQEVNRIKRNQLPNLHSKTPLPLENMSFFASGADPNLEKIIAKLGGEFIRDISATVLEESNIHKKMIFLSDAQNRRTHKYILASALGVPMLHFDWASALLRKFEDYQNEKKSEISEQPSPFDSDLYTKYRYVSFFVYYKELLKLTPLTFVLGYLLDYLLRLVFLLCKKPAMRSVG